MFLKTNSSGNSLNLLYSLYNQFSTEILINRMGFLFCSTIIEYKNNLETVALQTEILPSEIHTLSRLTAKKNLA